MHRKTRREHPPLPRLGLNSFHAAGSLKLLTKEPEVTVALANVGEATANNQHQQLAVQTHKPLMPFPLPHVAHPGTIQDPAVEAHPGKIQVPAIEEITPGVANKAPGSTGMTAPTERVGTIGMAEAAVGIPQPMPVSPKGPSWI